MRLSIYVKSLISRSWESILCGHCLQCLWWYYLHLLLCRSTGLHTVHTIQFTTQIKVRVSNLWKPMLIFEITKTHTPPTPKGSRPYFDRSAPHIRSLRNTRKRLVLWNITHASPVILQTAAYLITSVSLPRLLQSSSLYLQTKYIKHHCLFSFSFKHINSCRNLVSCNMHYNETKYYIKHYLFSFSF